MSGFSFPPPPPPPPKTSSANGPPALAPRAGNDRGRGRGRGHFQQRAGTQRGRGDYLGRSHYHQESRQPLQHGAQSADPSSGTNGFTNGASSHLKPYQSNISHGASSPIRTAAGHKRKLDALRGPPQRKPENKPAPATAPSIPTFGAPLPPANSGTTKTTFPQKASANHKQKPPNRSLGLTPGAGDPQYSSSDNEDEERDVDEEAMYAELGDKLTFEHNGVVMSLSSQADVLAWKKERQRNWPTKARMVEKDEERKRVGEERKRLLAGVDELYGTARRFSKEGSNVWTSAHLASSGQPSDSKQNSSPGEAESEETDLEKAKREMSEKTKRLEELRRKVVESEARNRQARESMERSQSQREDANKVSAAQSGEVQMADTAAPGPEDEAIANDDVTSDGASSEDSDSSSETTSSADSSDEAPEELSTKAPTPSTFPEDKRPVCKYFRASGWCRDGDACRFKHDPAHRREKAAGHQQSPLQREEREGRHQRTPRMEPSSEGKKTIYQRLVEQEEEGDDKLALKVVKYLGEMGFFRAK